MQPELGREAAVSLIASASRLDRALDLLGGGRLVLRTYNGRGAVAVSCDLEWPAEAIPPSRISERCYR
jgi:hypothetical protein